MTTRLVMDGLAGVTVVGLFLTLAVVAPWVAGAALVGWLVWRACR